MGEIVQLRPLGDEYEEREPVEVRYTSFSVIDVGGACSMTENDDDENGGESPRIGVAYNRDEDGRLDMLQLGVRVRRNRDGSTLPPELDDPDVSSLYIVAGLDVEDVENLIAALQEFLDRAL